MPLFERTRNNLVSVEKMNFPVEKKLQKPRQKTGFDLGDRRSGRHYANHQTLREGPRRTPQERT